MRKTILLLSFITLSCNIIQAQQKIRNSLFRLINQNETKTDIVAATTFVSSSPNLPSLEGYILENSSDTLFVKILYKENISAGSNSTVDRNDTFPDIQLSQNVNYLYVSTSLIERNASGNIVDTTWNESDSTFVLHPVGIDGISKNVPHIAVYPNPANNTLFFEKGLEYRQVQVYNSIGRRVASYPYNNTRSIDISALAKGFYFLKLNGKKEETLGWARFVKTE